MKPKRILFWITFPLMIVVMIIVGLISGFCDRTIELMHWWEGWTGDYKKSGFHYLGDGIWTGKEPYQ